MTENYTEGLIFTKNLDDKGTPFTPKLVEVGVVSNNGKIQCKQNIYKKNGISLISPTNLRKVSKPELISNTSNSYFIYEDRGEVLFSEDLIGQVVVFEYYGTGSPNIGDCRVYTTIDNNGNITETLNGLLKENRKELDAIIKIGGGIVVLNKLEELIKNAEILNIALGVKITVGNALDKTLRDTIKVGNDTDDKVRETIRVANETDVKLNSTITTGSLLDTSLKSNIIKGTEVDNKLKATIVEGEGLQGELAEDMETMRDLVDAINVSDNKVVKIEVADWTLNSTTGRYEKLWKHDMNKTTLIFEYMTLKNGKKCSYFMDYEIQDENNVKFITESNDIVFVVATCRYYTGLNTDESTLEVDKMIDGVNKVVMTKEERELLSSHSASLEDISLKYNGIVNTSQFKRILGEVDDTGRIRRALLEVETLNCLLVSFEDLIINDTIELPPNKTYLFYGKISTLANPTSIFNIDSNTVIECNIELDKTVVDSTTKFRGIEIRNNSNNVVIKKSSFKNCYYGVCGFNSTLNNIKIIDNIFETIRGDIHFDNIVGSDLKIEGNISNGDKQHTIPQVHFGEIYVCCGFNLVDGMITDEIYNNRKFKNINISNNNIKYSNHRPIFVTNGENVNIIGNIVGGRVGDKFTIGVSDDCIIVDLCNKFNISNNTVEASGENGIDILSSIFGTVKSNRVFKCDDYAITIDISDRFMEDKATLSDEYLIPTRIVISNNIFEGRELSIASSIGSYIDFRDNLTMVFGSGTNGYFFTVDNPKCTSWIKLKQSRKINNFTFIGNKKQNPNVSGIRQNNRDIVEQGTIHLERDFGVIGYITNASPSQQLALVHNVGKYNFVKIEVEVNGEYVETSGFYYDGTNKFGIFPYLFDINQVQVNIGTRFLNIPAGAMGAVVTGKIKLTLY